jgi:hypothetical protein
MPRGGKRPGAGAPKGHMTNLKHGLYSRQFAQVGALLASDPKIREGLLELGRKHGLKQQKANEVAALLFTRMYQRAENIAGDRLNLRLPTDDFDSIKQAAEVAALRQIQTALRNRAQKSKTSRVNQTPDTPSERQSKRRGAALPRPKRR